MPVRSLLLTLLLLLAVPALAQQRRIDVLTGEPYRAPTGRPEPEIFNAPHAPRQQPTESPPLDIYVAPQIGTGDTTPGLGLGQYRRDAREPGEPRWRHPPDLRAIGPTTPYGPRIFDRIRQ